MSKNKIALITGGSRGLGKNTALALAAKGTDVIITYHTNKSEAENVVSRIMEMGQNSALLKLDTSQSSTFHDFRYSLESVLKKTFATGSFDFLVNNAGVGLHSLFSETTEEDFDNMVNIHFKGVFFLTQNLLPLLNDGGAIVNVSSGLSRFTFPGSSAYASMKGAIEILTKYLAKELGSRGIRANVVAPGAIETDFSGGRVRDNSDLNKQIASITALGRVGLPDDIGSVVAFLCSDDAKWVNGQRLEASGGMSL